MSVAEDTIHVGEPLPRISGVRPVEGLAVAITWASGRRAGRTDVVDLAPVVKTLRFYRPLRHDAALFANVTVTEDGSALAWDGGRLDMAATTVERLAAETMSAEDFRGVPGTQPSHP
jgi:acyl dehydratase